MAIKKGICKNFDNCSLADNHEIQEVESTEFVCRECGKQLYPIDDQGGGGTIAYILGNYNMNVIDAGIPVLNMHAPMEIVSKADVYEAYKAYLAFLVG